MGQQRTLRNKQFINHNKQDKNGQLNKNMISPVCACVHVGKVYWVNVSVVGPSKEDKNWLYLHTCVCVCVYMWVTVNIGL